MSRRYLITSCWIRASSTDSQRHQAVMQRLPALSGGRLCLRSTRHLGLPTAPLVKQVYRKDLVTGALLPVSVATGGGPAGDYLSIEPSIAGDGAVVAFMSPSTNLAPDGGNRVADVFAKVFSVEPPDAIPPTAQVTAPRPADGVPRSRRCSSRLRPDDGGALGCGSGRMSGGSRSRPWPHRRIGQTA